MAGDSLGTINRTENVGISKALAPTEGVDSYRYSFNSALTDKLVQATGIGNVIQKIVPFGGGLELAQGVAVTPGGKDQTQTSRTVTLKIAKNTPRSVVEEVFNALNRTGKIKINLSNENYSPN